MENNEAIFGSFNKEHYKWNVLDEKEFKDRYMYVFDNVARVLSKTFGPFGAPSIIKDNTGTTRTKDGWNVLKRIQFNDMILNTILDSLVSICSPVVTSSGDGSTTCIEAANELLKLYLEYKKDKNVRPKEFLDSFTYVVDKLIEKIEANTNIISDKNLDRIYKLALTSSNNDEKISQIVYSIYKQGAGPNIDYIESKGTETSYEIVKGFRADISYIDKTFVNSHNGLCEIEKPLLLMIDHTLEYKTHRMLIDRAKQHALQEGRRLVIIGDYYDKTLLNYIQNQVYTDLSNRQEPFVVYCKVSMPNSFKRQEYNDFSSFTGGKVLGINNMFNTNEETGLHEVNPDLDVREYFGRVDKISIGKSTSLISGFSNMTKSIHDKHVTDAQDELNEEYDKIKKGMGVQLIRLQQLKQRCIKLSGQLAMIYVGGMNPMEKKVNYDAVEDVVKACESAYRYGYNIGGSLIIPICGQELKNEMKDNIYEDILDIIINTFKNVFKIVLRNKEDDKPDEDINNIIETCINEKCCFDLLTDEYSYDIINPTKTDTEILRATTSIINSLMTSNQFISVGVNSDI